MSTDAPRGLADVIVAALLLVLTPATVADELITQELIDATEQEARRAAELAHEYQRVYNEVQRDLEAHNLELNSGVILSDQLRGKLNAAKRNLDKAGLELRHKVVAGTGTRDQASERMFELAYHWGREQYGFANKQELDTLIEARISRVWILLATLAFLIAYFGRFKRSGGVRHITPLQVPEELRSVNLPGLKYAVGWVSGVVADKEMWTETTQTHHITNDTFIGQRTYVTTNSVTKGRLYLITHDGREHIYDLHGADHRVRPGNLITSIDESGLLRGTRTVTDFNHATREVNHYNLWRANGSPWLINLLITGLVAYYAFGWAESVGASVAAPHEHQFWLDTGWAALVGVGLALAFHIPITFYRNLRYKRGFISKAERLIESQADTLRQAFTPRGATTTD